MNAVYLDHAATTPVRDEVRAAMEPYMSDVFGNPSSLHRWGRQAASALEDARADIASALGASRQEIRFVRGGTESDNLAVVGSTRALTDTEREAPPLVVSSVEHSAVLEAAESLSARGEALLTVFGVDPSGAVDMDVVEAALARQRGTVSMMWVNNETGMILPVEALTALAHVHCATVHTDASQAVGKVPVRVDDVPVDLLTATGHKINGPRGTGILYVRSGTPLSPMLHGGGQERALRPGTEDVAGAVGLATAIRLAVDEEVAFAKRASHLRDHLERELAAAVPELRVNGGGALRAPHVSSLGIPGVSDGQALLMALDLEGVAASGGSACHSGAGTGSHVIAALFGDDDDRATIRFSYGRSTVREDVDRAVAVTRSLVHRLRRAA